VLCSTNLDDEGKRLMRRALKVLGCAKGRAAEVEDFDATVVTHVVTRCVSGGGGGGGGSERVCKRTLKYAQGVLAGCWVVSDGWLAACVAAGARVAEAPFEISGDSAVPAGGAPRKAREAAARGAAPLWAGFAFRIVEPLTPLKRVDAAALLAAGGGAVLGEEELFAGRRGCLAPLCVLSMQTKHWAAVGKAGALDALRAQCKGAGVQAVDQLWLLDCVSHYKALAPRDYSWESVSWSQEEG
jgi:hypothetical protein